MSAHPCRFCGAAVSLSFADLGMSPLSNAYLQAEQLSHMERFYPLHARVCSACWLVQVEEFAQPEQIFSNYAYFSSYADSWLEHCKAYVASMVERFALNAHSLVVEIASNDGYLLQYFVERNIPVLGIEPAANVAAVAQGKGIATKVVFFGRNAAQELVNADQQADLIVANNVLAHVPALNDFVGGISILLKPHGVATLEFPHLLRLMQGNQWDTIYHEHFSYFSLSVVQRIFATHQLTIFDVDELPTHGGSLRIYARHSANTNLPIAQKVDELCRREQSAGLDQVTIYHAFAEQSKRTKRALLKFLIDAAEAQKSVVGYGAPAKGVTLLNYCGVRSDLLAYTVDRSPHKQGHFLPGVHIPIEAPERIFATRPDYVLILPWNLRGEISQQLAGIRAWGGRLVVAIPQLEVID